MTNPRALLFASSHTFSHVTRALTLAEWLEAEGFEAHLGLAASRVGWAGRFLPRCHEVHELWEASGLAYPSFAWFSDAGSLEAAVRSQEAVMREVRPDLVVAVFDFAARLSTRGAPLVTVNGACMLPCWGGVLGFDDEPTRAREEQRRRLESFWTFAGRAFRPLLAERGMPPVRLATELLIGDASLVYEVPEVCGLTDPPPGCHLVGPIPWAGWESLGEAPPWGRCDDRPTVYVNSGSLPLRAGLAQDVVDAALSTGARVLASTGVAGCADDSERLFCRPLLRPAAATAAAHAVVCTGGVGVCYTNLYHAVPSLVLPTQPEQATNGIHLERAGCGRVLLPNVAFAGSSADYARAVDLGRLARVLGEMLAVRTPGPELRRVSRTLRELDTRERVLGVVRGLL